MPFDAVCLQAVLQELRPKLLGLRIDKVQQPARAKRYELSVKLYSIMWN